MGQDAVENELPDVAQYDAADQIGHEEGGTENVGAWNVLGQDHGDRKGNDIDQNDSHDGKGGGKEERMEKFRVLEGLGKVGEAHELCVSDRAEVAQGQVEAHQKRDDKANDERQERGAQKDGKIAFDGFFHNRCAASLLNFGQKNGAGGAFPSAPAWRLRFARFWGTYLDFSAAQLSTKAARTVSQLASVWSAA